MEKKTIQDYIEEMVQKLYEEFKGTPSNHPIVRNNQKADAFALAVLKVLYEKRLDLSFHKENCSEIAKFVVAPPDSGIDIFIAKESGDDVQFDVIQVKYTKANRVDIASAFSYMKQTISDFCKNPKKVNSETCREILAMGGLDKNNKKNCQYYVVHTGDIHGKITSQEDEIVLNLTDLDIIINSLKYKVSEESFKIENEENILEFGKEEEKQSALVFNLNCYELAKLNLKYYSTEAGRNILFGYNLREMIKPKQSRSYTVMQQTLIKEPTNFWYYNNGITIVAEDSKKKDDTICVSQFSIVNGAQTTSALGLILNDAIINNNQSLIDNMKKAYVIARVLKVADDSIQHNIAIYNNTQNPINSRDMVANNIEQRTLHDILLDDNYPKIYMEIRRGANKPQTFNKFYIHRNTTNEALAQLAYAGFLLDPGTAKDKKVSIFTAQEDPEYVLNEFYHKIFYYDETGKKESGILFRKTKQEIDELLFSNQLYKDCKNYMKKSYQNMIDELEQKKVGASPEEVNNITDMISQHARRMDTVGICMVYFVAAYANLGQQFGGPFKSKRYDYDRYYSQKDYREKFIKEASRLFLAETVKILIKTATENHKEANMNNWVRSKTCPKLFLSGLNSEISSDPFGYREKFENFMETFKVVNN